MTDEKKRIRVIYKGDDKHLKRGKIYTVKEERTVGWETKYLLEEEKGEYDYLDFGKKEYLAETTEWPRREKPLNITIIDGDRKIETTIVPDKVVNQGIVLFKVETKNSVFLLKVNVE